VEALRGKCDEVIEKTKAMDDLPAKRFPKQWATPKGGDFRYWHAALEDTELVDGLAQKERKLSNGEQQDCFSARACFTGSWIGVCFRPCVGRTGAGCGETHESQRRQERAGGTCRLWQWESDRLAWNK